MRRGKNLVKLPAVEGGRKGKREGGNKQQGQSRGGQREGGNKEEGEMKEGGREETAREDGLIIQ